MEQPRPACPQDRGHVSEYGGNGEKHWNEDMMWIGRKEKRLLFSSMNFAGRIRGRKKQTA